MRYKHVYCVYPRGFSKSFLAVLCLMIKCILYPNAHIFVVSAGKEQSAGILSTKVSELCRLIPAIENEIVWDTRKEKGAKTSSTRDSVVYTFKNGSQLENIALTEKTRGRRFHSGLIEEAAMVEDATLLNEVVLPTLTVLRTVKGQSDPNEVLNQSTIYITSAGYKNSFAYEKLLQFLCESVVRPNESIILGGTWRLPVVEGLQPKNFIEDLKMDGTYNEASFDREFNSIWAGSVEGAFFDMEKFAKQRTIEFAEHCYSNRSSKDAYYVLGVDVGRKGCTTEVCVCKVTPSTVGLPTKKIVNLYSFDEEHFGLQSIKIKKIFRDFKCRAAVVDANGLGIGLVDFLVLDQTDPDTGEELGNLGIINDDEGFYRKFENENTVRHAMYIMKATNTINSELYAYTQNQLLSGKLCFLIDDNIAKNRLESQSQMKKMNRASRNDYLQPYVMTSVLREQMANLMEEHEGALISLKQASRSIKKDKFSALIYALFWPKHEEESHGKRHFDVSKLTMFTKH